MTDDIGLAGDQRFQIDHFILVASVETGRLALIFREGERRIFQQVGQLRLQFALGVFSILQAAKRHRIAAENSDQSLVLAGKKTVRQIEASRRSCNSSKAFRRERRIDVIGPHPVARLLNRAQTAEPAVLRQRENPDIRLIEIFDHA